MKINTMEKKDCCGCGSCEQICPKRAILMVKDNEEFSYPVIDESLCINCNLCEKVCGFAEELLYKRTENNQEYYWVKNKSEADRMRSRSGGFFYLLATYIISLGGVVYGAIIDENNYVKHIRATSVEECKKMQGSKYVESDISGIYSQVKEDLVAGMQVLFSGTGCQVSGLYGYLRGYDKYKNIITVDIVCHGVCSPKVFKDYVAYWEQKYKGKITEFNFRNKELFGWESSVESFVINNKRFTRKNYNTLFYSHNAMRPSCSNCQFANLIRMGDFSLADFWGMKKYYPSLDDNKGVSSIFVNTEHARGIFKELSCLMDFGEVTEESVMQPNLIRPTEEKTDRTEFWSMYEKEGFGAVMVKYGGYDYLRRLKWWLKTLFI